jgi:predicted ATPase
MRIKHVNVNNFKSLVGFGTPLAKFSCLIGLNGVGKSTVLQFVDFLAQQVRGDIKGWLEERHWRGTELSSRLSTHKNIEFNITFDSEGCAKSGYWHASFNTTKLHCTEEFIEAPPAVLEVKGGRYRIYFRDAMERGDKSGEISFSYEGSVLSQLREAILPPSLVEFKKFFSGVRSFDLLSPENMRQRARESDDSIGRGGKGLSSFLHKLGPHGREQLTARLKSVYPQLESVGTRALRSGWKQLEIQESFGGRKIATEARHVNEGMLRLIAILAELQRECHRFLMFDEIENGINPELVEFLLDALVSSPQQVMVTTHSPLILNYLDDEVARDGVLYLYKSRKGETRAVPFFQIPSLAEKLKFMGPGEVFADTDLTALIDEVVYGSGDL